MNLLILGIGQTLRGDDAAGLETVRIWQAQHPDTASRVKVEFSELPGLDLLNLLEGVDVAIIVDAVRSAKSSGTVIRLGPEELASFTQETKSAHGWGVAETLQLGLLSVPSLKECRVTLIGIVGKNYSMGARLSSEVQSALDGAAYMVEREIQNYLK